MEDVHISELPIILRWILAMISHIFVVFKMEYIRLALISLILIKALLGVDTIPPLLNGIV